MYGPFTTSRGVAHGLSCTSFVFDLRHRPLERAFRLGDLFLPSLENLALNVLELTWRGLGECRAAFVESLLTLGLGGDGVVLESTGRIKTSLVGIEVLHTCVKDAKCDKEAGSLPNTE